jgi:hypothetical protein
MYHVYFLPGQVEELKNILQFGRNLFWANDLSGENLPGGLGRKGQLTVRYA